MRGRGGIGLYVGSRRASVDALRERAERLDRERELLAERAVAEERVRIAQELHDVVAHNVSLIVVQAQALGATAGDERVARPPTGSPTSAARRWPRCTARSSCCARRDDAAERAPQPGLGDLDDAARARRAPRASTSTWTVEGGPRPLAQSVDLSAFRIVQEALTNVVKHAGRAHRSVTLGYRARGARADDRRQRRPRHRRRRAAPRAGGHGLIGMRERTALFGGTLTAGPRDGRGFEVRASLPYGEARA